MLSVADSHERPQKALAAVVAIDTLIQHISDGLPPIPQRKMSMLRTFWLSEIQSYIEYVAYPYVGIDRLAIALGHYRDHVLQCKDKETRVKELRQARMQLMDLYNSLTAF